MTDAKAAPMTMTIRKETLRDQRAKMLAAAPDWRASDARVNPRVAIGRFNEEAERFGKWVMPILRERNRERMLAA